MNILNPLALKDHHSNPKVCFPRCLIYILLCGARICYPAADLYYCRVPAPKAAVYSASMPPDDAKAAVFLCIHCIASARSLLYHSRKSNILKTFESDFDSLCLLFQEISQPLWATTLMSAYYPLLMTCASLVVCLWAEVFHLRDIRWEKSQFLSKSFLGFLAFNLFPYSLLAAEVRQISVLKLKYS